MLPVQDMTLPIDDTTVTMDWVLGFDRARKEYDKVFQQKLYRTPEAQKVLRKRLQDAYQHTTDPIIPLSDISIPIKFLHALHINHVELWEIVATLDDLGAALGNFSFYVVPVGTALRTHDGIVVTINSVAVYLLDVVEFNESQWLGFWEMPDRVSYIPSHDAVYIENADFGKYRDATRRGGDFKVFAKPKVTALDSPESFILT
jgi:hypothetical protein